MSYYYINTVIDYPLDHKNWKGTVILPKSYFLSRNLNDWRALKDSLRTLNNAGWHFSFVGGAEKVKTKIESYAHSEFNNDNFKSEQIIKQRLDSLEDPLGRASFKIKHEIDFNKFPKSSLKFNNLFFNNIK
jgi:beta-1,4-mannosyl-glycoprotein beta-1,4-N-acetylglucosaminyltransferase